MLVVLKNKYKQVSTIQGHKANIICIKYFLDNVLNIEYLIAYDYNGFIIITNISLKLNIKIVK